MENVLLSLVRINKKAFMNHRTIAMPFNDCKKTWRGNFVCLDRYFFLSRRI